MDRKQFVAPDRTTGAAASDGKRPARAGAARTKTISWRIGPFVRPANGQPILRPDKQATFRDPITHEPVRWKYSHVFNPGAIAWNGKLYVLFRAEDTTGRGIGQYTSRLGLAESADGRDFTALPRPVFYPQPGRWEKYEWPGGCEDPRIVQSDDDTFILTYTMWDHKIARLGVATSRDLIHWKRHGPVFRKAFGGRFVDLWTKSGAIVTQKVGGRIIAAKINGKYWMYWHADDQTLLAHSEDLLHWSPVLDATGKLRLVLPKNKPGYFDSRLTEPGPPALLTPEGIVLFYNGMSGGHIKRGPKIPQRRYSAGQALFAGNDPAHLIQRPVQPFFRPEEPWEKTGQYKDGDTFIEGLAWFQDKWFLFYGGADTEVGMAMAKG